MKISWGVGISFTIIVFMLISFWLIYFSFSQEINLVRDDYYDAEIKFNEKMEAVKRTNLLAEKLNVNVTSKDIKVSFPKIVKLNNVNGTILLYRPSDRDIDIKLPIQVDSSGTQQISTKNIMNGMWKVQVEWIVDSTSYYNEKIIMVQ